MSEIDEIKAYVRRERVSEVLHALRNMGASRFYVTHVHVHGAGVDPGDVRYSFEEEDAYTEKAKVEVICDAERTPDLVEAIREAAGTGHRGDGVVAVSAVRELVSVRTGDREALALL